MSRYKTRAPEIFQNLKAQREALKRLFQCMALPITVIVIWQMLSYLGCIRPIILPSPARVARTFLELLGSGDLLRHIGISILRVSEGLAIAAVSGLGLGIAIGLSRTMDRLTDLMIQFIKPIPPIAWIPLAILWFGIGEQSKIYIIFLGAFFPIIINTSDGIRRADYRLVEVARILEAPRGKFIRKVAIPTGSAAALSAGRDLTGVWYSRNLVWFHGCQSKRTLHSVCAVVKKRSSSVNIWNSSDFPNLPGLIRTSFQGACAARHYCKGACQ